MMGFFAGWQVKVLAVLLLAIGAGAGGFKLGADHEVASQAREDAKIERVSKAATDAAVEAIGRIRIEQKTIQRKAETIIKEVPVYRECVNTPDVRRLLDDARAGGQGGDRDSVPGTGPGEPQ